SQLNEIRDQSQTIKDTAERSVTLASELQQSSAELDGILSQYRLQWQLVKCYRTEKRRQWRLF
ncbi:hypothetical protein, partial [Shewanella sp.]|uniref:hypothetical protein n=1 Tax=Shewanella sp. TaxID=50422 RepID=UPI003D10F972